MNSMKIDQSKALELLSERQDASLPPLPMKIQKLLKVSEGDY